MFASTSQDGPHRGLTPRRNLTPKYSSRENELTLHSKVPPGTYDDG
ncbi:hypothetical protein CES85_2267 [Ochrobactrum quorumnocens]|uniref:Uncharacterized protein n=1 Tax=Ochrobactrum quorumnocens TaxID=271865 RepID=A0A248UK07_9HYPH|nr:hypothetical protein CES85_2267 [[Ochrobactrum] quorumnocens]